MEARCTVCSCPVSEADSMICPSCSAMRHRDCSEYYMGCGVYACENSLSAGADHEGYSMIKFSPEKVSRGIEGNLMWSMYVIGGLVGVAAGSTLYPGLSFIFGGVLGALVGFGIEIEMPYLSKPADPPRLLHREDEEALRRRDQRTLEQRVMYTL